MPESIAIKSLGRMPTQIHGFDRILNGGLLLGGAYIVMGVPGTGKTTLGTQISFRHVAGGGRVFYLTLLAENHARMMQHMASFRFFDASLVGHGLSLVSAFNLLESEGLKGVLALLNRELTDKKITLLVIDGLVTAEALAPSETDIKKFIHELQALLSLCNCTALLLTNPAGRTSYPAHTMVDGVFELRDDKVGLRAVRRLNVAKFRGSEHLRGEHVFDITKEGITLYPRLESMPAPEAADRPDGAQAATGVVQLDQMLGGGVPAGSTTLVLGPTGGGKTLLGLQFLATGAARGERSLYVGFSESERQLRQAARGVQIELDRHLDEGTLELRSWPAAELNIDAIAFQIITVVEERRVRRLFIDGLNGYKAAAAIPERVAGVIAALTVQLRALGVTVMIAEDTNDLIGTSIRPPTPQVASRADNVFFLRYIELRSQLHRLISIVKARGCACDGAIREFVIGDDGIAVANTFESAEAVLSGMPRTVASPPTAKAKSKPRGKGGGRRRP